MLCYANLEELCGVNRVSIMWGFWGVTIRWQVEHEVVRTAWYILYVLYCHTDSAIAVICLAIWQHALTTYSYR